MKKLFSLFIAACLFSLQACAVEQWKEGEHYEIIADKATDAPVVTEFFSFWCPHCFQFEPIVGDIKKALPEDVKFDKVHVNFMGFTSKEIQDSVTRAMIIGRELNKEEAINTAIFQFIHIQRGNITRFEDLRGSFIVNGVEEAELEKLAKSFSVNSKILQNNKKVDQFKRNLQGVPTFIVNGKYKAKFTRDMTPDDFVELIVWLTKLS
ncbi:thiol:disulfide interchange protein DsbA/DsbL [Aestuariibacter sp. AA17]|uniref:Thiol:disulfide interchange protein n=1 Tax=Fluctibacter corallii TaxID=2984329 RepID=A0ABT3A8Y3_9ALTE|nr:thiol:disulfide interchange protein DsbA/DsbL [Aestuariibacter sp. AA17]MCV2884776.1 thiol:disulfide interchange protein DsbA/DsbL [Aestuariibacter sp. AA17]